MNFLKNLVCSLSLRNGALKKLGQRSLKEIFLYFIIVQIICFFVKAFFNKNGLIFTGRIIGYGFIKLIYLILFMIFLCKLFFKNFFFKQILKVTLLITFLSLFSIVFLFNEQIYKIIDLVCGVYALIYYYLFLINNLDLDNNPHLLGIFVLVSNLGSKVAAFFTILMINSIINYFGL